MSSWYKLLISKLDPKLTFVAAFEHSLDKLTFKYGLSTLNHLKEEHAEGSTIISIVGECGV